MADLYHYTTRDFAAEVLRDVDEPGAYAEISDGLYGPGFYALDLGPGDADRDRLRWECFDDSRQGHPMDGVLVLDPDLAEPPFEFQERHIWLIPVDPATDRPPFISPIVTAVGIWDAEAWEMTPTS